MNTKENSSIRMSWQSDWQAIRSSRSPLFFESPTMSAAIVALRSRDSRIVRLMNRTMPSSIDAAWMVHARCGQYALNQMRRQS